MPGVRRQNVPPAPFQHLPHRVLRREIPASQLELPAKWLDSESEVPVGRWYKRFSGMTVCGEVGVIKTFPLPGRAPKGQRVP